MSVIGVVVPVYKVEAYLDRCVKSILAQTFADFQLILVEDGSPDKCGAICDAYAQQDDRIHVIHQKNAGLSAARNAAIDWLFANSDCQWLTFIDSDDWVHPEFLERLLNAAVEHNVTVSICGYGETEGENPVISPELEEVTVWKPDVFYQEYVANATIACAKLYRKSCFEKIRYPVGKIHEDEFVTYRILFMDSAIAYIPAPLYAYYVNPAGITKKGWSPKRLDAWEAFEQQLVFFETLGNKALVEFRYRSYLNSTCQYIQAAQEAPNAVELKKTIQFMKKRKKSLIRRAWKRGILHFWMDFDMLYDSYPIMTKLYRLLLELRSR